MWRTTLSIAGGLIGAVMMMGTVEAIGHIIWPPPDLMDPSDPSSIAEHIAEMPVPALLWISFAWLMGTTTGCFIGARWSGHPTLAVAFITAFMLTGGVMTLTQIPHPTWFAVTGCAAFPLGALIGVRLGQRNHREATA